MTIHPFFLQGVPNFYNFATFSMMLSNNAIYGILAVGTMVVLLTGGIDLSIGSIPLEGEDEDAAVTSIEEILRTQKVVG